ncbi:hypothetical protein L1987_83473 [Smallanthus sonchifolius]|uniref:Uncharacterized protein n=1 Tax=Smallanthus sonchifolius TaxID=185202 RepID=A0ACB8YD95_9ASTR|nr:hypothetical protein L1987_83473 [Smallanthus sonchifolius]
MTHIYAGYASGATMSVKDDTHVNNVVQFFVRDLQVKRKSKILEEIASFLNVDRKTKSKSINNAVQLKGMEACNRCLSSTYGKGWGLLYLGRCSQTEHVGHCLHEPTPGEEREWRRK